MMRMLGFALALSSCAAAVPGKPAAVLVVLPVQVGSPVPAPVVPPIPGADQLLTEADHARSAATRYVFKKHSDATEIDSLTALTHDLNVDLARMAAHKSHGHYREADVAALRRSLQSLRAYLMANGMVDLPPATPHP